MHKNYKTDEKVLRDILKTDVVCTDPNYKFNLIIYYRNNSASSQVMKNNTATPPSPLQQKNLVYEFNCPLSHSKATSYIGYTECTLNRRITGHYYSGSIKQHFIEHHNINPTKQQIADNTKIIAKANDEFRLTVKEAILILQHSPIINRQFENFQHTLKLHRHRPPNNHPATTTNSTLTQQSSADLATQSRNLAASSQTHNTTQPQLAPSPLQDPPSSPLNQSLSTPNRVRNINISPNIQNRIDLLIQSNRYNNLDTPHNVTPTVHDAGNSHPYYLRSRHR